MTTGRRVFVCITALTLCVATALAEVSVDNVTAKQRYPWNGKVDITYTVSGEVAKDMLTFAYLDVMAKDGDTGTSYAVSSLSGDVSTVAGTHAIVWDAAAGDGRGTSLSYAGSSGDYWSSVPYSDGSRSWYLVVKSGNHGVYSNYYYGRYYGWSVRPVQGFAQ